MLLIGQPKSASTSLLRTLSEILNIKYQNGLGKLKNWEYCEGFSEIQKYHDTTIKRDLNFMEFWIRRRDCILKEHILPTEHHMNLIKKVNGKILILLRKPEDSLNNYMRMYEQYKRGNLRKKIIDELMPYRFDKINFDLYFEDLILFNKNWREFDYNKKMIITFEDLILRYEETIKNILLFFKFKMPKKIISLFRARGNHGYNTYTGVGRKRIKKNYKRRKMMISSEDYKRAWENRVSDRSVHLNRKNFVRADLVSLFYQYQIVIDNCKLENKTIIDFGCGGGLLGACLFDSKIEIKKYIGVDVAQRCVVNAIKNNKRWKDKAAFEITDPCDLIDIKKYKADILIALNVIRFLPDMEYVEMLLNYFNKSKIKEIFLHFRVGKQNEFREKPYKTTHDIGQANYLTIETIKKLMNKYETDKSSNVINGDCYICFKKKAIKRKLKKKEE